MATFFHRPESNKVDPRTLDCIPYEIPVDESLSPFEMLQEAWKLGLPKGSARCGCIEIQTDDGIWSSNRDNRITVQNATFTPWDA